MLRWIKRILKAAAAIALLLIAAALFVRHQGVQYAAAYAGGGFARPMPPPAQYRSAALGGSNPCAAGPINVVTYNIFNGSVFVEGLVERFMEGDLDGFKPWSVRTPEIRDRILGYRPDIIGLQEVGSDADVRRIVPAGQFTLVSFRAGRFEYGDAALLFKTERFDLLESGQFWLGPTPDLPMSYGFRRLSMLRYVNWAVLREKVSGFTFLFANTHFDNTGVNKEPSAPLFRDRIAALARDMPVVATGDFNSRGDTDRYRVFTGAAGQPPLLINAFALAAAPQVVEAGGTARPVRTEDQDLRPEARIDHILVGGPCKAAADAWTIDLRGLADGQPMSDHELIAATLRFGS